MRRVAILLLCLSISAHAGRTFNGSTDVVAINGNATALDLSGQAATISFWIKMSVLPIAEQIPVSKGYGGNNTEQYYVSIGIGGNVTSFFYQNVPLNHFINTACSTNLTTNTWYHIAASYSASTVSVPQLTGFSYVYLNGVKCGQTGTGANGFLSRQGGSSNIPSVCFGGYATTGVGGACSTLNFAGTLAEVAIWSDELTPNQIQSLASGVPPWLIQDGPAHIGGLVGYWPLYGASSPEPDLSGNALNGVLTGTSGTNHPPMLRSTF
jgi:hypothetical protein